MTLAIANPIPVALRHYETELCEVLEVAGVAIEKLDLPSIERSDIGSILIRAARSLAWRRCFRTTQADTLVLWPVFGLLDPLSLRRPGRRTWLVVHDPEPLRRQFGMGSLAALLGGRGLDADHRVLVHSVLAHEALARRGWASTIVPHPVLPPSTPVTSRGDELRALGQWKAARSLDGLGALAADGEWDGRREICGRGWPDVSGWRVDSRFLSEAEMDSRISGSAAVVIPYERYFQSGIAVRCLERGVPVVGETHPFLVELFGADWPGFVVGGDWASAVRRGSEVAPTDMLRLHERYWARCVETWGDVFARVDQDLPPHGA